MLALTFRWALRHDHLYTAPHDECGEMGAIAEWGKAAPGPDEHVRSLSTAAVSRSSSAITPGETGPTRPTMTTTATLTVEALWDRVDRMRRRSLGLRWPDGPWSRSEAGSQSPGPSLVRVRASARRRTTKHL